MKFDWMGETDCIVDVPSRIEWDNPRVMAYTLTHAKRLTLEAIKYSKEIHIKTRHLGDKANKELYEWMRVTCHKETVKLIEDWKI